MANEVTVNASLAYADAEGTTIPPLTIVDLLMTISTKKHIWTKQNIGTSEEAINLGEVTSLGYALFINRDPVNFVELRVATGGAKFAKLRAGQVAMLPLGSGAQVPFAIADTAACQLEYLIISA